MKPALVGILNLTDDSFSDGGRFREPAAAVAHALGLLADGAQVLDVGPAASHPEARPVPAAEEIRRLEPVLDRLLERGAAVSVDSWQAETQRWAIGRGVAYLNDIRGFPDEAVYPALAAACCRLVVMHSIRQAPRATREPGDAATIADRIVAFFAERTARLEAAGIGRDRLVLDPGMGYFLGGNPEPSIAVLRQLRTLRERLGLPLWVSVSRKSFLGAVTGRAVAERGAATLAAELHAAAAGVDYVRTHDVRALRDGLAVVRALGG